MSPRVAIVGGGAGGLAAAWTLGDDADFVIYEAASVPGGNVATFRRGDAWIDLGVAYFHPAIYPVFLRSLSELGVATKSVEVSMAVSKPELLFWESYDKQGWVRDHVADDAQRFVESLAAVDADGLTGRQTTIHDWCRKQNLSHLFERVYLLPLLRFGLLELASPVGMIVDLFDKGVLSLEAAPCWLTIEGGCQTYVERIVESLGSQRERKARLRLRAPVRNIERRGARWRVATDHDEQRFDTVILAVPRSQHRRLLGWTGPPPRRRRRPDTIAYVHDGPLFRDRGRLSRPHRYELRWGTFTHNPYLLDSGASGLRTSYSNHPGCPLPKSSLHQHAFELERQDVAWFEHSRELSRNNGRDRLWFAGAGATSHSHEAAFSSGVSAARAVLASL
jgi:uncharacterized protein